MSRELRVTCVRASSSRLRLWTKLGLEGLFVYLSVVLAVAQGSLRWVNVENEDQRGGATCLKT